MANVYQSVLGSGGATPTSITPSNSSPVALTANTPVNPTAAGYAIESYSSKTPDDSTPPTVASGDIVKMGGAGYLYETQQGGVNLKTGTVAIAATTSTEYTINTGLNSITRFGLHAYSNKANYGKAMQFYNQWDSSDPTMQYVLSKYSSNGGNTYTDLTSTSIATAITIESVSGGTVKIKSPSNTNWNDLSLEWWAW